MSSTVHVNYRLLDNFLKLFNNQEYSDLAIKIKDKYIYVHKSILRTNSNYFKSRVAENSKAIESKENTKSEEESEVIKSWQEKKVEEYLKALESKQTDSSLPSKESTENQNIESFIEISDYSYNVYYYFLK
jgi:hypothetical protein